MYVDVDRYGWMDRYVDTDGQINRYGCNCIDGYRRIMQMVDMNIDRQIDTDGEMLDRQIWIYMQMDNVDIDGDRY